MTKYLGLETLVLDLIPFDIEEIKDLLIEVCKVHRASLTHLSIARNKISAEFLRGLCEQIAEGNNITFVDMIHMKDNKNMKWEEALRSISLLSTVSRKTITVKYAEYQAHNETKAIHAYLEKEMPLLDLNVE